VFAIPGLASRAFAIAFQQPGGIQLHQAVLFIGIDSRTEPTGEMELVGNLDNLAVRDSARNPVGQRNNDRYGRHGSGDEAGES